MNKEYIIVHGIHFMHGKHYHFPDGWVEACLDWLFEEHRNDVNNASVDKWFNLIEQQWLFTDLRDLEITSLLGLNNSIVKGIFTGIVCLQVMQCEDISKSFYGQLCEVNNANTHNIEDGSEQKKESLKRALQLHFSDGINTIRAFEFECWSHIRAESLSCGSKCRLKGPFTVLNGVALLKTNNIEALGGEVEELKSLSKIAALDELLQHNIGKLKIGFQGKSKPAVLSKPKTVGQTVVKTENLSQIVNANTSRPTNSIAPTNILLPKVEIKRPYVSDQKESVTVKAPLAPESDPTTPRIDFEDDDDEFMKAIEELPEEDRSNDQRPREELPAISAANGNGESCTLLIDIFTELAQSDSVTITSKRYKVKALIICFLSKFTMAKDDAGEQRWTLQLRISDGTSSLDCQLSDEFMTARIGFSAATFHLKKQTSGIGPLKLAIENFHKDIMASNCFTFTLQLSDSCDKMEIVDYVVMEQADAATLKEKVAQMLDNAGS